MLLLGNIYMKHSLIERFIKLKWQKWQRKVVLYIVSAGIFGGDEILV